MTSSTFHAVSISLFSGTCYYVSCSYVVLSLCVAEQSQLEQVEMKYIVMPGWKCSISGIQKFAELPPNARTYVEKLVELMGLPSE